MAGKDFAATFLQGLMQDQVDMKVEYQRLSGVADQRIAEIDKELIEIDQQYAAIA